MTDSSETRPARADRRVSLSLVVPACIGLVGLAAVGLSVWHQAATSLQRMEEDQIRLARLLGLSISANLESALRRGDSADARRAVEHANTARNLRCAFYVDPDDRIVFSTRLEMVGRRLGESERAVRRSLVHRTRGLIRGEVVYLAEETVVVGAFPTFLDAGDASIYGSRVGVFVQEHDLRHEKAAVLRDAASQSLVVAGGILVLCVLLWFVMRRVLLVRLGRVQAFADAVSSGRPAPRIAVGGRDEIAALARRLEEMARGLEQRARMLQQSQRMEAVGRLAGGIAHDFNNLLTVIRGNVELAQVIARADRPIAELTPHLLEVEHASTRAAALTGQLLAFSRRDIVRPRVLLPARIIADMAAILDRVIGPDHDLALTLRSEGRVRIDRTQLEQVIINLVVNARDAMSEGGVVELTCKDVARPDAAAPWVVLEVRDHGCGIPAAIRDQIFDPFFTTKPHGSGTGLGLATVYLIVREAAGSIDVVSGEGEGSTFRVSLPSTSEEPDPTPPPSDPGDGARGETVRVLLCEDEEAVRLVVGRQLRDAGCRVVEARNGREALGVLANEPDPPDVVVTDVLMPELDGLNLAREVAALHPAVRFVFITGYTSRIRTRDLATFADSVLLPKPFSGAELAAAVRGNAVAPATRD